MTLNLPEIFYDQPTQQLILSGEWTIETFPSLSHHLKNTIFPAAETITLNGEKISKMDSAGAWLILRTQNQLQEKHSSVKLAGFSDNTETLISLVEQQSSKETLPESVDFSFLENVGKSAIFSLAGLFSYLNFVGRLTISFLQLFVSLKQFRFKALFAVISRSGFDALPIIGLLSMMIGVVLTYQMGLQLKNYGANIFIVDLLGLSVLREFAPLITAIMVAGRTGSAFTAQIGMMKINQEIDALNIMGVSSNQLLMLPRIFGLLIALPLLTVWSDVFGIIGGMFMSNSMLNIGWSDFLNRFSEVIPLKSFLIGIGKTPIFALIIASIGCYQGISVKGTADSVGKNTTRSVVLSIFFIIIADAIFSILFSKLKL